MDGITWKTHVFYEMIVLKSFLKEEDIAQGFRFPLFISEGLRVPADSVKFTVSEVHWRRLFFDCFCYVFCF
jgi:hypothetical protein